MQDEHALDTPLSGRIVVIGVTRDHSEVWSLDERQRKPLAVIIRHDERAEHRHVKTGQFGHGHESEEGFARYFSEIADIVAGVDEIMIAGHGSGRSNTMEAFAEWLRNKRVEVFRKVTELRYVDIPHTTGRELAALARKWKEDQRLGRA